MPTSVISLLIFVFVILPGLAGQTIYSQFIPANWRQKDWEAVGRVLVFSVLGFILYYYISKITRLPEPIYVYPSTFSKDNLELTRLGGQW